MWGVACVEDGSPPADRDAELRAVSRALRHDSRILTDILAAVRPRLAAAPDAARLLAPVDDYLLVCPGLADAWDPDTTAPGSPDTLGTRPLPPLSNAHLAALRISGRRLALRTAGLLHRLVRGTGHDPTGALPLLDRLIDSWCAEYRDGFGARWIPVARQAEYQARVVLGAFELALGHARVGSRSGEPGWGTQEVVPMHRE
jgi:hypothetical protein